jgi:hypothetical protein
MGDKLPTPAIIADGRRSRLQAASCLNPVHAKDRPSQEKLGHLMVEVVGHEIVPGAKSRRLRFSRRTARVRQRALWRVFALAIQAEIMCLVLSIQFEAVDA